jgi:hypothetical protein
MGRWRSGNVLPCPGSVTGSIPVRLACSTTLRSSGDRAPGFEPGWRAFESCRGDWDRRLTVKSFGCDPNDRGSIPRDPPTSSPVPGRRGISGRVLLRRGSRHCLTAASRAGLNLVAFLDTRTREIGHGDQADSKPAGEGSIPSSPALPGQPADGSFLHTEARGEFDSLDRDSSPRRRNRSGLLSLASPVRIRPWALAVRASGDAGRLITFKGWFDSATATKARWSSGDDGGFSTRPTGVRISYALSRDRHVVHSCWHRGCSRNSGSGPAERRPGPQSFWSCSMTVTHSIALTCCSTVGVPRFDTASPYASQVGSVQTTTSSSS